MTIYVYVIKM